MKSICKKIAGTAALLALSLGITDAAHAQNWPSQKPVRIVVGFAPGGTTDVIARVVAQTLGENIGQSVVVDNKPGAGGNIAATEVIRATPDGYTVLIAPTSVETANPFLFKQTILPSRDLTPVTGVGLAQMYLVVKPDSTAKDAKDLVNQIKANPAKFSYASAGPGTPLHLAGELFNQVIEAPVTHVPYKGAAPALQDLLSNNVDYMFDPGIAFSHVRSGKLRMLAVASKQRSVFFPNVPTMSELGLKGAELDIWFGLWVPNGTPADITNRLTSEIAKVMNHANTKTRLEGVGTVPVIMTTAAFKTLLTDEGRVFSKLIKDRKISLE